jgi:prepilin-type N-terminal cleavage/methylation domain-containing protein
MKDYHSACRIEKRRLSKGFTMMEVMIVVLILSILAVAGFPALNATLDHARLSAAAEEVVNALQYAQLKAMTSGLKTRVSVSPTYNTIYVRKYKSPADFFTGGDELVAGPVESEIWEYMEYPLKKGVEYVIDFNLEDRFKGVQIFWSDLNTLNPVYFDTLGSPSHGGNSTLVLGGQQIVVTLDGLTGKVSVSE